MADEDNDLQAKAEKAEAEKSAGTVRVMGYKKGGKSQIFTLKKGEKMPDGWSDTPPKGEHPHEKEKAALGLDDDAEDGEVEEPTTGKGKGGKKA